MKKFNRYLEKKEEDDVLNKITKGLLDKPSFRRGNKINII